MKKYLLIAVAGLFLVAENAYAAKTKAQPVEPAVEEVVEEAVEAEVTQEPDSVWMEVDSLGFRRIDTEIDVDEYDYEDDDYDYDSSDWMSDFTGEGKKWSRGHWAGFGVNYCGLIGGINDLSLPNSAKYMQVSTKSIGFSFNMIDFGLYTTRKFSLFSGIGFELNNFVFENKNSIMSNGDRIVNDDSMIAADRNVVRSKLVTSYMNVPLLVEYRFGRSNKGFVNAGGIAGLHLGSYTKIRVDEKGDKDIYKHRGGLHMRNFHYGFAFNVGYHDAGLMINYFPHSIFRDHEGPSVQQVNIGIAILM